MVYSTQPHFWGRLGSRSISKRTAQSSTLCPCSIGATECHPANSCASDKTSPILTQARSQRVITLSSPSSGARHSLRTPYCSPISAWSGSIKSVFDATFSTKCFDGTCVGTDEEYMSTLAELIRESYSDVFVSIDPSQDSQVNIVNFFRRYTPASQRSRMVIFFLGMCREAGIATLDVPRQRASNASPGQGKAQRTPKPAGAKPARVREPITPSSPAPALDGLIKSLPPVGEAFPGPRRQQWLAMVQATLAYLYPDEPTGEPDVDEGATEG